MTNCKTTHHFACDCREQYFKELEDVAEQMANSFKQADLTFLEEGCYEPVDSDRYYKICEPVRKAVEKWHELKTPQPELTGDGGVKKNS
jgi:hypothetical protein